MMIATAIIARQLKGGAKTTAKFLNSFFEFLKTLKLYTAKV